jgi:hypothetical protein
MLDHHFGDHKEIGGKQQQILRTALEVSVVRIAYTK